jgi:choline kinase
MQMDEYIKDYNFKYVIDEDDYEVGNMHRSFFVAFDEARPA